MRILLVSWEYPPVIEGGLGRHVHKLAEALAAMGHDVHVLTRGPGTRPTVHPGDVVDRERADLPGTTGPSSVTYSMFESGVHVHRVEIPPFSLGMDGFMEWVAALNELLAAAGAELLEAEPGFELVHSHDWIVAGAAERLAGVARLPWMVTVHATEFGRHNGWVQTEPQRAIHRTERRMVQTADHVICCSRYMAGHVERIFGLEAGQVSAIPNGIDAADLALADGVDLAALRRRYAADDERLVLMIGRLVYEKGFHLALEALSALAGTRFVVAGTGPAAGDLQDQARELGLDARGTFLGRVDDDRLHALYRACDCVVVPSLYEPFGIVPLEAMTCGCPVVVADTGGLREVVSGSGAAASFVAGDVASLTATLEDLLADPSRRAAMARAARAHTAAFDWGAVGARTAELYAETLARTSLLGV